MEQQQTRKPYVAKRILGVCFLVIGMCLLANMILSFRALLDGVHSGRDFRALWVFGFSALVLISAGVALIRKPNIFDGL